MHFVRTAFKPTVSSFASMQAERKKKYLPAKPFSLVIIFVRNRKESSAREERKRESC